jgi:hypothetical protein
MSLRKSNFIGASPSYTGVVAGSSVAVASIQPLDANVSALAELDAACPCGVQANNISAVDDVIVHVRQIPIRFVRM